MRLIVLTSKAAFIAAFVLIGCGGAGSGSAEPAPQERRIDPSFPGAANFVSSVTNQYLPLTPKKLFRYRSETDKGVETTRIEVLTETKSILDVACTIVHDQVFLDGDLIEDTFDWIAQDKNGNVWYFGEDSHEIENGGPINSEGSWEAGKDGAVPGILMLAHPKIADRYHQEFLEGVAEDEAKVLSLRKTVTVPAGTYSNCVQTMDWTQLDPGHGEFKYYAPGVGLVLEVARSGGGERNELISVETLP